MYSLDFKVCPSDCDEGRKLRLYRVMQMMQDCSELWFESEEVYKRFYDENGRAQLLAYRQLDIVRVPEYGENLRVSTSVFDVNPLFGYRNTNIFDSEGNPCYLSWAMGAFVERATGKLSKVPDEITRTVTIDEKTPMEYTERRIVVPKGDVVPFPPYKVRLDDIDYNHHMNNAHYMRLALEVAPVDFPFDRVRMEYKVPAKKGDVITPKLLRTEDSVYVTLYVWEHVGVIMQFCKRGH